MNGCSIGQVSVPAFIFSGFRVAFAGVWISDLYLIQSVDKRMWSNQRFVAWTMSVSRPLEKGTFFGEFLDQESDQ